MIDVAFLAGVFAKLFAALPVTLELFAASIVLGGMLALGLLWLRLSGGRAGAAFARGYVFVFRGSPLLIQMFLVYYGLGQFAVIRQSFAWPVLREPFACAVLSLALCNAAYATEILRGGLLAVPPREIEAGRAIGLSGAKLLRRIIAPVALRAALPAYTTEIVLMLKSTALASLVTVWEITGIASRLMTQTYRTMEVFLCAAAIYLLLNFLIVRLLGWAEWTLSPHLRPAPHAAR